MTEDARNAWEEALIGDLRENDGRPSSGPLAGQSLLVMYSTGAKSGERRRAILTYSRDGDAYVVAGSANGSSKDPAWLANVRANPDVTLELGKRTVDATASVADGTDRERLWDAHVQALPWFADYPAEAGRPIPMVRLTPRTS
jgi:deazaflavin-dependent oxidoreductase (nitroreductase family)